jgi:hypothetical protein
LKGEKYKPAIINVKWGEGEAALALSGFDKLKPTVTF